MTLMGLMKALEFFETFSVFQVKSGAALTA
jgi:hypothetical protein